MVLHVLDRRELDFPFTEASNFVDLESGQQMPIIPEYLRDDYRDLVGEHIATLSRQLAGQGVDYAQFDTSQPMDRALFRYLGARRRFERSRKVG